MGHWVEYTPLRHAHDNPTWGNAIGDVWECECGVRVVYAGTSVDDLGAYNHWVTEEEWKQEKERERAFKERVESAPSWKRWWIRLWG
jgi:hypothetical protein